MTFRLEIEGFSGPLDLLCHMVESQEIRAADVKVSQVVSLYGAWLAECGKVDLDELASFIAGAARLVLQKTKELLPRPEEPASDEPDDDGEMNLEEFLQGYRPYRKAAGLLAELYEKAAGRAFKDASPLPASFDLGDLMGLSLTWLSLYERRRAAAEAAWEPEHWEDEIGGVPLAIPDEQQVQQRMDGVMERLAVVGPTSLRALLSDDPGRGPLVVTLLALLELSRRNMITLAQEVMFGDVQISLRAA